MLIRRALHAAPEALEAWARAPFTAAVGDFPLQVARTRSGEASQTLLRPLAEHWAYLEAQQHKLQHAMDTTGGNATALATSDTLVEARWMACVWVASSHQHRGHSRVAA